METLYRRIMTREGYTFEPIKIDTLQRLSFFGEFMAEDKDGRYIRYDDLVELLNR